MAGPLPLREVIRLRAKFVGYLQEARERDDQFDAEKWEEAILHADQALARDRARIAKMVGARSKDYASMRARKVELGINYSAEQEQELLKHCGGPASRALLTELAKSMNRSPNAIRTKLIKLRARQQSRDA